MQLTPEQAELVRNAKACGEKSIDLPFTPEQRGEWERAVAAEESTRDQNILHFNKVIKATKQPGFFGDIRRAVQHSLRPANEIAKEIGIDDRVFSDFLAAEIELPASALDRLVELLGLRLMQEIPR
jgi:hypothetical protein